MASMRVRVQRLSGEVCCALNAPSGWTVLQLKEAAASAGSGAPSLSQRLVQGGRELVDGELLADALTVGDISGDAELTLIVKGISELLAALLDSSKHIRVDAMRALQQRISDPDVLSSLQLLIDGPDWQGINALSMIAEKGNPQLISTVAAQLEDEDELVREAAVEGLAEIAEKGDQRAISAVAAMLEADQPYYVRTKAVQALGEIAEKGDQQAISLVAGKLEDERGSVRETTLQALAEIAE